MFVQVKVNVPSVWIIAKSIYETWSFCVPLEIAWCAKCGTRVLGCRPLCYTFKNPSPSDMIYHCMLIEVRTHKCRRNTRCRFAKQPNHGQCCIFSSCSPTKFGAVVLLRLNMEWRCLKWKGLPMSRQDRRQRGASGARPPHLKSVPPHFMFGPPVAAYIQYCILKMCHPLLVFGSPCC